MKVAIIKTGGKQYKVQEGDTLRVEKLDVEEGGEVVFDEILLVGDDQEVKVGTPLVEGAKVEAKLEEQTRDKKVVTIKHKAKKRYLKKMGHRQSKSVVKINRIEG